KKVVSVSFPTGSVWEIIDALNVIRNYIVHNEGKLPEDTGKNRKKIDNLAKKWHEDISIDYDEIELHKTFIFRVLDTFRTFSNELFAGLRSSRRIEDVV